jgi:hypothetical protein
MRAYRFGLVLLAIVAVAAAVAPDAHALDFSAALKSATRFPTDLESDTLFANGFDNAGYQCLTVADCGSTGSQCSDSVCDEGLCTQASVAVNSVCTAGIYCNDPSCACDGTGTCVRTCSMAGSICYPQPDQCHNNGLCNGSLCSLPPAKPDGSPCNTGAGMGFCMSGVCN